MDLRGQRFTVDLSDDEEEHGLESRIPANAAPSLTSAFIGDIKERSTAPPTAPKFKSTATGFPEHKKRTRVSAFKQQRGGASKAADSPNAFALPKTQPPLSQKLTHDPTQDDEERKRINEENNRRLADMSAEEIDEERQELLSQLNPSLIERLLKRANLDEGRGDTDYPEEAKDDAGKEPEVRVEEEASTSIQEPEAVPAPRPAGKPTKAAKNITQPSIHFPTAPTAPDLDPSDPSFLTHLHEKYYPTLPSDPSKLAWMAPLPTHGSIADQDSPYYPSQDNIPASALRFDFRGSLLPPRISRAMPSTKGLHHHGEAPEAAGYTVPELARLARSAFPAQRCIAFQTLGRLLYRLGRGEYGGESSEIGKGLWRCVEEGKVLETLQQAAGRRAVMWGSRWMNPDISLSEKLKPSTNRSLGFGLAWVRANTINKLWHVAEEMLYVF
ncbi:RNA polymerase II-associated of 50 kDa [Hyphodiscus hymeniophilus]|uniref:RNA polymerase II-associated of 50 kDa n=1 Tax=Hyphodiscus hymeniophilus TaxID=353542 RepID=A0A9P7AV77_9HELO|nr:RNA polymerase II-associated of 50 kDa [Hyphodiscus hymeniophilus]